MMSGSMQDAVNDGQRLAGRVVVVTGAARGIGRAVVEAVIADGGIAIAVDLLEGASAFASRAHIADASSPADMAQVIAQTVAEFGHLDAVVANAGLAVPTPPTTPLADAVAAFDAQWQANARAAFVTGRAAIDALVTAAVTAEITGAGPSDIILVSTDHVVPNPTTAPKTGWLDGYDAAKWALEGMRRNWASTLRAGGTASGTGSVGAGVRVNTIGMGETDTPMLRGFLSGRGVSEAKIDEMATAWMTAESVAAIFVDLLVDRDPQRTDTAIGLWPGQPMELTDRLR